MIDIDDFKKVNDVFGHAVGDQVLAELADHLRATVRATDVVCRIGGEEFAVIVPVEPTRTMRSRSRRGSRSASSEVELDLAGRIAVSIGIAQGPEHAANPRELVACAEAAMMTAKARGKNQVVLFDDSRDRAAGRARRARRGHPLDRAPEDAPVARRQAEPLERRARDRDGDRERAPPADRLPQLPHLRPRRRGARADRLPGRADRAGPEPRPRSSARRVGEGFTGHVVETGEPLLLARRVEVRVRDRRSRARRRSTSRSSRCRSTTAPA